MYIIQMNGYRREVDDRKEVCEAGKQTQKNERKQNMLGQQQKKKKEKSNYQGVRPLRE